MANRGGFAREIELGVIGQKLACTNKGFLDIEGRQDAVLGKAAGV